MDATDKVWHPQRPRPPPRTWRPMWRPVTHVRCLAVCLGLAMLATGRAATFQSCGPYGFASLAPTELPDATRFEARLVGSAAAVSNALPVGTVIPLRTADGWQLFVGGWPDAPPGRFDLLIQGLDAEGAPAGSIRIAQAVEQSPRRLDVCLVLDDSFSMRRTDPRRLRVAAARLFARIAAARGEVGTLSIVAFNRHPRLLLAPTPPGETEVVDQALERLAAEGSTDLDAALALACRTLDQLPTSRKVVVVLSDGRDEPGDYANAHVRFAVRRWPIYTVGLSDDIDAATLDRIALATGGTFHRAESTDQLQAIFRRIALDLHRSVTLGDWPVAAGTAATLPVDETVRALSLTLLDESRSAACSLVGPDGVARALSSHETADGSAELFAPPRGAWSLRGAAGDGVLLAQADSDLEVILFPETGAITAAVPVQVACLVLRGSAPVTGAVVEVAISPVSDRASFSTWPSETITLRDDGRLGDGVAGDGVYGGWVALTGPGRWTCRVRATGRTSEGWPFERRAVRGWVVQAPARPVPLPGVAWLDPQSWLAGAELRAPASVRAPETGATGEPAESTSSARRTARTAGAPAPPAVTWLEPSLTGGAWSDPAPAAATLMPPEPPPAAPPRAAPGWAQWARSLDWLHILLILLLIGAVLAILIRWLTRARAPESRMAKFFAFSTALHAVLLLLTMDLLVQTRVVKLEELAPGLAVSIEALERTTGVQLTPPGPAIRVRDRETATELRRVESEAAAEARAQAEARPDSTAVRTVRLEPQPIAVAQPPGITAVSDEPAPTPEPAATPQPTQAEITPHAVATPSQTAAAQALSMERAAAQAAADRARTQARAETAPIETRPTVSVAPPTRVEAIEPLPAESQTLTVKHTPAAPAITREALAAPATKQAIATPQERAIARAMTLLRVTEDARTDEAPAARTESPHAADAPVAARMPKTTVPKADVLNPAHALSAVAEVVAPARRPSVGAPSAPPETLQVEPRAKAVPSAEAQNQLAQPLATERAQALPSPSLSARPPTRPDASATSPVTADRPTALPASLPAPPPGAHATAQPVATFANARPLPSAAPAQTTALSDPAQPQPLPRRPAAAVADQAQSVAADRPASAVVLADAAPVARPAQARPSPESHVAPGRWTAQAPLTQPTVGAPAAISAVASAAPAVQPPAIPDASSVGPAPTVLASAVPRRATPAGPAEAVRWATAPAPATDLVMAGTGRPARLEKPAEVAEHAMAAVLNAPAASPAATAPLQEVARGDLAIRIGGGGRGTVNTTIGLARYGGDWDCARSSMLFLGHQLRERTRMAFNASDRVIAFDNPELRKLPFVFMTGHRDFRFTDAEVANLRAYLHGGGYLWADDSTHFNDDIFDQAFRREIARVLPDAPLARLGADFGALRTGYDLTAGYKGYAIPPGDKYRLDYLEGATLDGRVAVVYSRNDYGDGLNIDAHTHPLKVSLTDLSPAEMQEGATRMGINLALYFLTRGGGHEAEFLDRTRTTLRAAKDASVQEVPAGVARPWPAFAAATGWEHEPWSDPGTRTVHNGVVTLAFEHGAQEKAAFAWLPEAALDLAARDVVVLEVTSDLRCAVRLALGLEVGGRYFESTPAFIKPGDNLVCFPCDTRTFKTETGGWAYRDALPVPARADKATLLVYSPIAGQLHVRNARIVRRP